MIIQNEEQLKSQEYRKSAIDYITSQENQKRNEFNKLKKAAQRCHQLGMRVHAGHGLDLQHTQLIKSLPYLKELNIGHSIVCFSLEQGIEKTVRKFKSILK